MSTEVKEEQKEVIEEKKQEDTIKPSDYSCEMILEKTTIEKSKDPKFPSDAFNVTYVVDGTQHLDVVRSGKQVNVFDFYYDKYGKDAIKRIEWGYGNVNPNSYGYQAPEKKKKRK